MNDATSSRLSQILCTKERELVSVEESMRRHATAIKNDLDAMLANLDKGLATQYTSSSHQALEDCKVKRTALAETIMELRWAVDAESEG